MPSFNNVWRRAVVLVCYFAVAFLAFDSSSVFAQSVLPLESSSQSSTSFGGFAVRAIDGNTSGSYGHRSVTHTNTSNEPWWSASLEQEAFISEIQLWNRTDGCCMARLTDAYVFVSASPFESTDLSTTLNDPKVWSAFHSGAVDESVSIPVNTIGRYVRIQLEGRGILSLAEVVVSGRAVTDDDLSKLIGSVFEDNGIATAHDGLLNGTEAPLYGVTVELRDGSGALIDSVLTNSDGSYELAIPVVLYGTLIQVAALETPGYISISEATDAGATGSVVDSTVTFTTNSLSGVNYQVDFGRVKNPSWLSDNVAENSPGVVVLHAHQYRANTTGELSFSYADQFSTPVNASYSAVLFLDDDCNGVINSGEAVFSSAIGVTGNSTVCIINKIIIPSNSSNAETYSTTIAASLVYEDIALTGHGVTRVLELTDITRTVGVGGGVLVLSKTVQNLGDGTGVTTSNSARPDDVLSYSVDFNNNGTGPVTEVIVADTIPVYTLLELPVACPATLPNGIVTCEVLLPTGASNAAGYSGPVRWQFDGSLIAGASGTVTFVVRVE